ncbi:hypothetical protein [Nostoc sp.]|nr:hypothetical protein [Nostoc sp. NMS9]
MATHAKRGNCELPRQGLPTARWRERLKAGLPTSQDLRNWHSAIAIL